MRPFNIQYSMSNIQCSSEPESDVSFLEYGFDGEGEDAEAFAG